MKKIETILQHDEFKVRPYNLSVPEPYINTFSGSIFSQLIRMRDDDEREKLKQAIITVLNSYDYSYLVQTIQCTARELAQQITSPAELNEFNRALPICTLANFFNIPSFKWAQLISKVTDFIQYIILQPSDETKEKANQASYYLYNLILTHEGDLLRRLTIECEKMGIYDQFSIISNAIGLFAQASDGTTALIAQMIINSYIHPNCSAGEVILKVLASDPPIKLTKRFPSNSLSVDGHNYTANQSIIINLKAQSQSIPFGLGKHECPGKSWATLIAIEALKYIKSLDIPYSCIAKYQWKNSPNARIPEFV